MKKWWLLSLILLAGMVAGVQAQEAQKVDIPTLTTRAYAEQAKDRILVVVFSATYCGPCKSLKKTVLADLVKQYEEDSKVGIFVLNTDEDEVNKGEEPLHKQLGVRTVPTIMVLFNNTAMYTHAGYSASQQNTVKQEIINAVNKLK